jgi:hypothetical protein
MRVVKSAPRQDRGRVMLFARAVDEIIPKVYAGFVMTLHTRFGVDFEDIVYALRDTQRYWQENEDIVSQCYRVTGIDVLSETSAGEQEVDGGMTV